jgi:hypothetical protein
METSISLGFNCLSAIKGIELGIRKTRADGYKTCPFDICYTNYEGINLCLKEDFKYFCDLSFIKLLPIPFSNHQLKDDFLCIYNTRYNFIFNHESPISNFYLEEDWSEGKMHFVNREFENFINRYTDRINNFRNYLKESSKITFILNKKDDDNTELYETITNCYPDLNFEILNFDSEESDEIFLGYDKIMKTYRQL